MRKIVAGALALSVALAGCASSSSKVTAAYVSPMQYQSYDCSQLQAEASRLNARVPTLAASLDQKAQNDAALTGVALLLFWPAAFALGGNQAQEAEYARLKGEADAIHQAAIAKKCAI